MKKPMVLFLCRHNSCRSQMAEAILRKLAGDRYRVVSAGVFPMPVHPLVFTVLDEAGFDSSDLNPSNLSFYLGRDIIDHIIIVCDTVERDCPKLDPFALTIERWSIPDPSNIQGGLEEKLAAFRHTRDHLTSLLNIWLSKNSCKKTGQA